jgi:hypothetical protein
MKEFNGLLDYVKKDPCRVEIINSLYNKKCLEHYIPWIVNKSRFTKEVIHKNILEMKEKELLIIDCGSIIETNLGEKLYKCLEKINFKKEKAYSITMGP